jgi:hypothetical protein
MLRSSTAISLSITARRLFFITQYVSTSCILSLRPEKTFALQRLVRWQLAVGHRAIPIFSAGDTRTSIAPVTTTDHMMFSENVRSVGSRLFLWRERRFRSILALKYSDDVENAHQKRIAVGYLSNDLRCGFSRSVSGLGFDAYQDRRVTGLRLLKPRGEFETVAGKHAIVVISSRDEGRRIAHTGFHVMQGRIVRRRTNQSPTPKPTRW